MSEVDDMNEAFDGLNKKFDTTFKSSEMDEAEVEKTLIDLKTEINAFKDKKLVDPSNAMVLSNQEYLRAGLKALILSSNVVLKKLEQDIKIGTNSRVHEVYAKLGLTIKDSYKELRELEVSIAQLKLSESKLDNNIANKKISMTSEQLYQLMDKAKKSSQMNEIVADFTVDEREDVK